ncbi:MAG: cytochrome c [Bacteroidota bacterium]
MKYIWAIISVCFFPVLIVKEEVTVTKNQPVAELLQKLGDKSITHLPNTSVKGVSVENGKRLFFEGFSSTPNGKKTKKQSKHFVCTSCHNVVKEDPDLSVSDPQARLEYADKNDLPFLQGTTMYGAVNRTSFYNGDYYKKYGDLVKNARNDIREAIQLCAVECAQGRRLKHWEIESILAYLWTIELKVGDLKLTEQDLQTIQATLENSANQTTAIDLIKSKYLQASPATFVAPPEDRKAGVVSLKGDPENGRLIYDLSCKHCHEDERYSFFKLDDSQQSFDHLHKHFPKYNRYSTYQVSRWGTSPLPGKKAYMPQYTEERMSVQQLEDLRAYVRQASDK